MVMGVCIIGVLVLPVTCIQPRLQCLCHGVDIGHVDCCWDGVVFSFVGDDFTSPYTLFLGDVCQYHLAAFILMAFKGLQAACLSPCFVFT